MCSWLIGHRESGRRPTRRFMGISLCPRFVWFTHVCQSKSGSRRVPVATNPIEEGHANGRTFTEDRNTVCRRWNRFASCGGFSRMYPTAPPIRFWLNMPRLIHSLMLSHRWGSVKFEFMKGVRRGRDRSVYCFIHHLWFEFKYLEGWYFKSYLLYDRDRFRQGLFFFHG